MSGRAGALVPPPQPTDAPMLFDRANGLIRQRRWPEAVEAFQALLELYPRHAEAYNNLGTVLKELASGDEAEAAYRAALSLRPDFPEAENNLGILLSSDGKFIEAETRFRRAIEARPDFPEAYNNLGDLLRLAGRLDEAEASARAALRLRPLYASAQVNLGNALRDSGRFGEARECYRQALATEPNHPEGLNNLASLLFDLGEIDAAIAHYRSALALKPDYADAHTNLALALLLGGHFAEGWQEYEWRWRQDKNRPHLRDFQQPLWTGEALGDRVLLVHAEQGFGDTLQFCRFVPPLAAGLRVVLEVQAPLKPLLAGLPGIEAIVARGDVLPAFDVHCPLLSLPRILGTAVDGIPAATPYLQADPDRVLGWRRRLDAHPGLKIGLVWAGNPAMGADRRRSIGLEQFSVLADLPGMTFVSLQKGPAAAETPPSGMVLLDWTDELIDFANTAALVEALDLVISVDTAVVHLAGALGRPVWLLNRFDRCWRWLQDRDDSPWYPTLRQFRQSSPGDWDGVLAAVGEALARRDHKAPSGIDRKFEQAVALHQAGELASAATKYREILAENPTHADSLHLLGVMAFQTGQHERAISAIDQALERSPQNSIYLNNRGNALKALGRRAEAEESYRRALALSRDYIDPQVNLGNLQYESGRWAEARDSYQAVVLAQPAHLAARLGLGNALLALGHPDLAEEHYLQALRQAPASLAAHVNLGAALRDLGRLEESAARYGAALELNALNPVIHVNLGHVFTEMEREEAAETHFRTAIGLDPTLAEAHSGLAALLDSSERWPSAEISCREAIRLKPGHAPAYVTLGNIQKKRGDPALAEASYREAIRLNPQAPIAYSTMATLLVELDRPEEAEAYCRDALRLKPAFTDALINLGTVLKRLGRFDEARDCYRQALIAEPNHPEGLNNLASLLGDLGQVGAAIEHYRSALALKPDYADAHTNLALALLLGGHFAEGWQEYEWRWRQDKNRPHLRDFQQPLWTGEALGDRVLLVHAEQGFGDTLQFCRFVPPLAAGLRVVLEVQAPLKPLLAGLPGIEAIVARGDALPAFDVQCPLLSLPRILGTAIDSIPAAPYLQADPDRVLGWRRRLDAHPGRKIGLAWAGNPAMGADRRRSLALEQFSTLADLPGVSFVSLQKGPAAAEVPPSGMVLLDWTGELDDFADTAALVEALDLVISVDTAVVHLAGALGRPVWLLNRFDRCWRWLQDRDDSPWYPTLRQFRQQSPGDWAGVLDRIHAAIERIAAIHDPDAKRHYSPRPMNDATIKVLSGAAR